MKSIFLTNFTDLSLVVFTSLCVELVFPILSMIAVCIYRLVMISIKWSETAQRNALASADVIAKSFVLDSLVIVTQLLRYHMPLLYFVCNHLILWALAKV